MHGFPSELKWTSVEQSQEKFMHHGLCEVDDKTTESNKQFDNLFWGRLRNSRFCHLHFQ